MPLCSHVVMWVYKVNNQKVKPNKFKLNKDGGVCKIVKIVLQIVLLIHKYLIINVIAFDS